MNKLVKRIIMCVGGVVVCGVSVGLFKRAELGVDPFQAMVSGLDAVIPIRYGTLYTIINIILLCFDLLTDRRKIGLATLINLFLLGYIAEFSTNLLYRILPEAGIVLRIALLVAGMVIMCLAAAFYFTADLGVSTYDAVALIWSEKQKKIPFRFCRIICDFFCVSVGAVLCRLSGMNWGGVFAAVGFGTVLSAFCMGPIIEFFCVHLARPFLNGSDPNEKHQGEERQDICG